MFDLKSTKTIAIIQARMSSTRRPGKVLEHLAGMPAIVFMVRRLASASTLHKIIVATSVEKSDDLLAETLDNANIASFRGSLNDVLGRYKACAELHEPDQVVRLTGDCPLIDPHVVDEVVKLLNRGYDYVSNTIPRTFPDGLDVEAFNFELLSKADLQAKTAEQREHVTPWMRQQENVPNTSNYYNVVDIGDVRWTVDYEADLRAVRNLIDRVENPLTADQFDFLRAMDSTRYVSSIS